MIWFKKSDAVAGDLFFQFMYNCLAIKTRGRQKKKKKTDRKKNSFKGIVSLFDSLRIFIFL